MATAWGCGPMMCPYPLHGDVALWRALTHGTGIWPLHRDVVCSPGHLLSGQCFAELSPTRARAVCSRCLESLFKSQVHRQLGNGTGWGVGVPRAPANCWWWGTALGSGGRSVPCSPSTGWVRFTAGEAQGHGIPLGPTLSHALRRSVPRRFSRQRLKRTKCSTCKICSVRK